MPFLNNEWKPNVKQEQFLAVPTSVKEAGYLGGAGSGKSEILLMYPIVHKWHENSRFKQVFMRRTFPELRNEIVPRSREIYTKFDAKFNKSDMAWTFPSGAVIYLGHCENEDDVHKYDSMEINLYTPDEITSFTWWIYSYIGFQRTRTSDPTLPAIIRFAGMPGGIGHTWVKNRFVKPYSLGGKILKGKGGLKRIFVRATLADNPNIDPNYSQSLDALPEAERRAKKFGDFDSYLGQVFEDFRNKHIIGEPDNALHVIAPLSYEDAFYGIPDWWPKIVAIDWGYIAATCVLWGAISPDRRIYIFREDIFYKREVADWCGEIKSLIDKANPKVIKLCQSASQHRGQEHTIHQQVESALGRSVELTGNSPGSRVAGKMLLHEYLRWKPKSISNDVTEKFDEKFSQWLFRNKSQEDYEAYLMKFQEIKDEEIIPKLQIFSQCTNLIEAIKACIYDKTNTEDVAEFEGDDPYDTVRYLIDACDKYFSESSDEADKLAKRAELSEIKDINTFYMRARRLDMQENVPFGVPRFHKAMSGYGVH